MKLQKLLHVNSTLNSIIKKPSLDASRFSECYSIWRKRSSGQLWLGYFWKWPQLCVTITELRSWNYTSEQNGVHANRLGHDDVQVTLAPRKVQLRTGYVYISWWIEAKWKDLEAAHHWPRAKEEIQLRGKNQKTYKKKKTKKKKKRGGRRKQIWDLAYFRSLFREL